MDKKQKNNLPPEYRMDSSRGFPKWERWERVEMIQKRIDKALKAVKLSPKIRECIDYRVTIATPEYTNEWFATRITDGNGWSYRRNRRPDMISSKRNEAIDTKRAVETIIQWATAEAMRKEEARKEEKAREKMVREMNKKLDELGVESYQDGLEISAHTGGYSIEADELNAKQLAAMVEAYKKNK